MNLKEIIIQLIQIALFFAFPTIWNWLIDVLPWWPLDPESTLNILIYLAITLVSWILGYFGIRGFITKLKTRGLAADVTA
jgi:hypothetical protein